MYDNDLPHLLLHFSFYLSALLLMKLHSFSTVHTAFWHRPSLYGNWRLHMQQNNITCPIITTTISNIDVNG